MSKMLKAEGGRLTLYRLLTYMTRRILTHDVFVVPFLPVFKRWNSATFAISFRGSLKNDPANPDTSRD